MFQFLDFDSPIKNAIILFILLVIILLFTKPKLLKRDFKNNYNKCYLPILIIILSLCSYYLFSVLKLFFGN